MTTIKSASLDELRAMKERGELFQTRKDASEVQMPDGFWDDAELVKREAKKSVHLRVDADVLAFFKEGGKGHLTRMNEVLRTYMEARKKQITLHEKI